MITVTITGAAREGKSAIVQLLREALEAHHYSSGLLRFIEEPPVAHLQKRLDAMDGRNVVIRVETAPALKASQWAGYETGEMDVPGLGKIGTLKSPAETEPAGQKPEEKKSATGSVWGSPKSLPQVRNVFPAKDPEPLSGVDYKQVESNLAKHYADWQQEAGKYRWGGYPSFQGLGQILHQFEMTAFSADGTKQSLVQHVYLQSPVRCSDVVEFPTGVATKVREVRILTSNNSYRVILQPITWTEDLTLLHLQPYGWKEVTPGTTTDLGDTEDGGSADRKDE